MMRLNKYSLLLLFILLVGCFPPRLSAAQPSLLFSPTSVEAQTVRDFTVSLTVDTSGYASGGVGAIVTFDPFMLSAVSIKPGVIFADYPITAINNSTGTLTISGIAASTNQLFVGSGLFAQITFKPTRPGSSSITLAHSPGSTRDSNIAVMVGNGDVLGVVNQVTVDTKPYSRTTASPSPNPFVASLKKISPSTLRSAFSTMLSSIRLPFLHDTYASSRSGRQPSKKLDPLNPIIAQDPITDPFSSQPATTINQVAPAHSPLLTYLPFILGLATLVIITFVIALRRNQQRGK